MQTEFSRRSVEVTGLLDSLFPMRLLCSQCAGVRPPHSLGSPQVRATGQHAGEEAAGGPTAEPSRATCLSEKVHWEFSLGTLPSTAATSWPNYFPSLDCLIFFFSWFLGKGEKLLSGPRSFSQAWSVIFFLSLFLVATSL